MEDFKPRALDAAKVFGVLFLLALALILAGTAHADVLGSGVPGSPVAASAVGTNIPDPCAPGAYDPDAGVTLRLDVPLPDGGAEDLPVALCPGQRAPAPGVFFTVRENAKRVAERAGNRVELAALRRTVEQLDQARPALLGTVAGVVTAVLVAWCNGHDCNPTHLGKR